MVLPSAAFPETWSGKVTAVRTGDTVIFRHGRIKRKFHIAGIEAPKLSRKGGKSSRASLARMCRKRPAVISAESLAGKEASLSCEWSRGNYADMAFYQLEQGWARLQPDTVDPDLVLAQSEAQAQCLGVWIGTEPPCTTYSGDFKAPRLPPVTNAGGGTTDGNTTGTVNGGGGTVTQKPKTGISGGSTTGTGGTTGDTITYEVVGTIPSVALTLQPSTGPTITDIVTLPFSIDYDFQPGDHVFMSAQNETGDGTISVRIYLNGKLQKAAQTSLSYGTVSLSCVHGQDC